MAAGLIKTSENWGILLIRIALGTIMFAHGAQKVFGWWGGPGFDQWTNQTAPFPEMRPSWLWMGAAAGSGVVGGGVGVIGVVTRNGGVFISCVLVPAIARGDLEVGFLIKVRGF